MAQFDVLDTVQTAREQALDAVVGRVNAARDAVRRPADAGRRVQLRSAKVTSTAVKEANKVAERVLNVPERVLVQYLHTVRKRAARKDAVGLAARTLLETVNTPAGTAAGFFTRIEKATALPVRAPRTAAKTTARATAAKAKPRARRTAGRTRRAA